MSVMNESTTTTNSRVRSASAVVSDSGSIATGLPAVIQTARTGGSAAASTSRPNSGSRIVRGAAFTPRMNEVSKAPRRRK